MSEKDEKKLESTSIIMQKVFQSLETADGYEEGDYLNEEGLLMCGKCHTPKQRTLNLPDLADNKQWSNVPGQPALRISPRNCDCVRKRMEVEAAEQRKKSELEYSERLRKQGISDALYRESTFALDDGADEEASRICRSYVNHWGEMKQKNIGLLLHGDVAAGKTFLASCVANELINQGIAVIMTTIPNLEMAMNANFRQERQAILNDVKNVPLLVLDDVGMGRFTPTALEAFYDIIDTRSKAKKPLIITTNLTMAAIRDEKEMQLSRIYSRIVEMCCVPVKVSGTKRRNSNAREKREEALKILGMN